MNEGIIIGGWNYVIAAYSITAVGLVAYAWSLVHRRRKSRAR
jgi:hypothetical protein